MPDKALKSMELPPPKPEAEAKPASVMSDGPRFPWGLSIDLNDDSLKALGMAALPAVGKPLYLMAKVNVTSVREDSYTTADGVDEKRRSVGMQITDMVLEPWTDEDQKVAAGDKLYGKA